MLSVGFRLEHRYFGHFAQSLKRLTKHLLLAMPAINVCALFTCIICTFPELNNFRLSPADECNCGIQQVDPFPV